jgi:hypothetical protein
MEKRQLHTEAKAILDKSHIFQADMSRSHFRFDTPAPTNEDEPRETAHLKAQYEHYVRSSWLRGSGAVSAG